jgi:hypothetical protein
LICFVFLVGEFWMTVNFNRTWPDMIHKEFGPDFVTVDSCKLDDGDRPDQSVDQTTVTSTSNLTRRLC